MFEQKRLAVAAAAVYYRNTPRISSLYLIEARETLAVAERPIYRLTRALDVHATWRKASKKLRARVSSIFASKKPTIGERRRL